MDQIFKLGLLSIGVVILQIYGAGLLTVAGQHPDFLVLLLLYIAIRYGRVPGIIFGFAIGLLQDFTGSLNILGLNTLAKSLLGYFWGSLHGNLLLWPPRVINMFVYGGIFSHAIITELILAQGLDIAAPTLIWRILVDTVLGSLIITAIRLIAPFREGID